MIHRSNKQAGSDFNFQLPYFGEAFNLQAHIGVWITEINPDNCGGGAQMRINRKVTGGGEKEEKVASREVLSVFIIYIYIYKNMNEPW